MSNDVSSPKPATPPEPWFVKYAMNGKGPFRFINAEAAAYDSLHPEVNVTIDGTISEPHKPKSKTEDRLAFISLADPE